MPKYMTVQIEEKEKDELQRTAKKAASKFGLSKLSLRQLIHMMHEQYKESL